MLFSGFELERFNNKNLCYIDTAVYRICQLLSYFGRSIFNFKLTYKYSKDDFFDGNVGDAIKK